MIQSIYIKNFLIVDQLELDLQNGMTVLTGETGAGKSILIDALDLVMGGRASPQIIRHGCDQAEIIVTFLIDNVSQARQWLQDNDFYDDESCCVLRRIINKNRQSKGYINQHPVNMQSLKIMGEKLVDIHSQHAHLALFEKDHQRYLLDMYCNAPDEINSVAECYRLWHQTEIQLSDLINERQRKKDQKELISYQLSELSELELQESEYQQLDAEYLKLSHIEELRQIIDGCYEKLYRHPKFTVETSLQQVINDLESLDVVETEVEESLELLNTAIINVQEAASNLNQYQKTLNFEPSRLALIEDRLSSIQRLAKKHQVLPEGLEALITKLQVGCDDFESFNEEIERLTQLSESQKQGFIQASQCLSDIRKQGAGRLSAKVKEMLRALGMVHSDFEVKIDDQSIEKAASHGLDDVCMLVSTNAESELQAMTKVVSGGELSRISLAIQVITANNNQCPTLIYDEVDVGIGGKTADVVGQMLRQLGGSRQILCVTHLPQVAASGHQHLLVQKYSKNQMTSTRIDVMSKDQRIEELARMSGGNQITAETRLHAEHLLNQAAR
ncbi:MAG: DNA repair protein RecN [Methylococcales bacterium]|jgi:DNA repair protein RecN (Recombination protein N)|nr:DNA repair protein RecN [Methylococcales bacterium]